MIKEVISSSSLSITSLLLESLVEFTSSFPETLSSLFEITKDYFSHILHNENPLVTIIRVRYIRFYLVTIFSKYYKVIIFDISDKRLAIVTK